MENQGKEFNSFGAELRDITNHVRMNIENQKRLSLEREWLKSLCLSTAQEGKDNVSPGRLEDKMPTNLRDDVLFCWCKDNGIMISGTKSTEGSYYTFYW